MGRSCPRTPGSRTGSSPTRQESRSSTRSTTASRTPRTQAPAERRASTDLGWAPVRRLPRPTLPSVAVTICLLVLTSAAALATSRSIDRREEQLLDERAQQAATMVDRRTDSYVEKLVGT